MKNAFFLSDMVQDSPAVIDMHVPTRPYA